MTKRRKTVITGCGIISAIGVGKAATLEALRAGRSGIGSVRYLPTSHTEFPVGEVKMSNDELRRALSIDDTDMSRNTLLGMMAVREALDEAQPGHEPMALVAGTTVGGMDVTETLYPDRLTMRVLEHTDAGSTAADIADHFGCFNAVTTSSTACSSAMNAIILGQHLIESGRYDVVVAGGAESLSLFHLNGFKSLMILDEQPCRPFDRRRHGLNLGEGAAFVVLESEGHARKRHARILARLSGSANACDAYHQTASSPDGEGAFRAMEGALREAGLKPADIQYINAHGTGTDDNDRSESRALRRLFGDALPPVSSTKSLTGHTTSACGGIETIFCLLALANGFLPANIGFAEADDDCVVPLRTTATCPPDSLRHVMCNSFGFGGNDSSLILSRPDDDTIVDTADDGTETTEPTKVYINSVVTDVADEETAQHLNPRRTRRFGRMLKRAMMAALKALEQGGVSMPDAIINGTAMGCLDDSDRLLRALHDEGEEASLPTHFMQSTHNTVASQIAIYIGCHGYNNTYTQKGVSFESALLDAMLLIRSGRARTALVCANEETPESVRKVVAAVPGGRLVWGDRNVAVLLSSQPGPSVVGELKDVIIRHDAHGDHAEVLTTEFGANKEW